MKIDDDHMFLGAALIQIAEDPHFKAINPIEVNGAVAENTFRINQDIGILLKYCATKPVGQYREYPFTFKYAHLEQLAELAKAARVFIGLVCVKARQVCCLPYESLKELIAKRDGDKGYGQLQYTVLVALSQSGSFRVYVNAPGKKGKTLGKPIVVPRNAFPRSIFS